MEQCPKRGPGLTHHTNAGVTCEHCGLLVQPDVYTMIRRLRASIKPSDPDPEPQKAILPADMPDVESRVSGRCQWQRGHWATSIWQVPLDGHWYCADHLRRILAIGWWKP